MARSFLDAIVANCVQVHGRTFAGPTEACVFIRARKSPTADYPMTVKFAANSPLGHLLFPDKG
jgi:hypothetical protein